MTIFGTLQSGQPCVVLMGLISNLLQQEGLSPELQELLVQNPAITLVLWLFGCFELYPSSRCLWIVRLVAEYCIMSVLFATR
jgi:hypothetical protein